VVSTAPRALGLEHPAARSSRPLPGRSASSTWPADGSTAPRRFGLELPARGRLDRSSLAPFFRRDGPRERRRREPAGCSAIWPLPCH